MSDQAPDFSAVFVDLFTQSNVSVENGVALEPAEVFATAGGLTIRWSNHSCGR